MVVYCIGGIVGLYNATISQLQQILCSRGYPDWFSGLCALVCLVSGVLGGFVASFIVQKTGKLVDVSKVSIGFAALIGCIIYQLMRVPDLQAPIAVLMAL